MKKIISIVLCLLMLIGIFVIAPFSTGAFTDTSNDLINSDNETESTERIVCVEPIAPPDYNHYIYCYNTALWDNVYAYFWSENDYDVNDMCWPGMIMRWCNKINGYDMYCIELPEEGYTNIIFTDGKDKVSSESIIQVDDMFFDNAENKWRDLRVFDPLIGDANKDGVVDITDATCIQKFLVCLITKSQIDQNLADVNRNGYVDIVDSTYIQKYLSRIANIDGTTPYDPNYEKNPKYFND